MKARTIAQAAGVVAFLCAGPVPLLARDLSQGLTKPIVLPAYKPTGALCPPPADLKRSLVFVQDNSREFMQGVGQGLAAAARQRGLKYSVALANNDAPLMIRQLHKLQAEKTGAFVVSPVDPLSLAPSLQQAIWSGAYVGTVVPPPAISLLNAPQYATGKVLADAAANYIRTRLNGKAKVVLLTHDSLQFLAPRFAAMRDTFRSLPGVTIVADISPTTVDKAGGYRTMKMILLAQPHVDVVLGADTVVLGALAALRDARKARPDQFLGGIDGEREAVAEIKKGNGPYKASISLASPIFGYAMGQHAADWLEGRRIPQAMDILPKALNIRNIRQFERDIADPAQVYNDPVRRASYLRMYGSICYTTRQNYINFPWSSEKARASSSGQ